MAALVFSSSLKFFMHAAAIFLCLFLTSCYAEKPIEARHSNTRVVNLTSLLRPSRFCSRSSKASREASMEIIHKYGPCSDQLIHGKANAQSYSPQSKSISSPDYWGLPIGLGRIYIIKVGLGTPTRHLALMLDSGSVVTWIRCKPCMGDCNSKMDSLFDPSKSKSYAKVTCGSPACNHTPSNERHCSSKLCAYDVVYGDNSSSSGIYATDKLIITSTRRKSRLEHSHFLFGCGHKIVDPQANERLNGIMGLGRHPSSIVYQLSGRYHKYFSMCLPSSPSSTGHITFGKTKDHDTNKFKYTPITLSDKVSSYYDIQLTGLSIDGKMLPIQSSVFTSVRHSIIDSGSELSLLPNVAYATLRSEFRKTMRKLHYKTTKPAGVYDTCFDVSNVADRSPIPRVTIHLKGGVKLELDAGELFALFVDEQGVRACFAFGSNEIIGGDFMILGNNQHKGREVVYDILGGRIGFGPIAC